MQEAREATAEVTVEDLKRRIEQLELEKKEAEAQKVAAQKEEVKKISKGVFNGMVNFLFLIMGIIWVLITLIEIKMK